MDIDDDYQSLSPPKGLSPQVQFRRLKRSKKSDNRPLKDPLFDSSEDALLFSSVDFARLEALENGSEPQIFDDSDSTEDASLSQVSLSKGVRNEFENGDKIELGFDAEVKKTKRILQFGDDMAGGSDEGGMVIGGDGDNFEPETRKDRIAEEGLLEEKKEKKKNKKRREKSDGGDESKTNSRGSNKRREENFELEKMERIVEDGLLEEKKEKKKNKKKRTEKSDAGDESKTNSWGSNKRREEKDRQAYLKELHAESQRLLRETGDASFKPIPVVQKPISSVLEKIRKRKLEISKKYMIANDSNNHVSEQNIRPRDRLMDLDRSCEERSEENVAMTVEEEMIAPSMEGQSDLAASSVDEDVAKLTTHENVQSQEPAIEEPTPTPAFRAPVDDTQDLFDDSEPIGATTAQDDEKPNSLLEDDIAPSLQAMDLKLDSGPVDDSSSEEGDNDKENFDPRPRGVADNSSPNDDPVRNFIDEEAEEEDDSDNDLNRFQENEVDEHIDDFEELNDMIATDYEERPADKETRNELHQKWLEQQDAAGTENLIQRLKYGSVLKETFLTDESEADEDDENDEEIDDEADEDSLPKESSRINIKKAKQIILQLYADKKEDTYLSDGDDDDMQRRRAQYLIQKEEQATISLPADDASSREVFGLIKKLNIAPDNKRKPKALSVFDSVLKGGSSGQSSKSSFLGRTSNHYIPSSRKQGSATFRSFIFGREDSSSRSSISISENSSDPVAQEVRPTKNLTSKYSNTQSKVRTQTTDGAVEIISKTSLLEILKRSSSETKIESTVDLTKSIFASRAPKKPTKIERRS